MIRTFARKLKTFCNLTAPMCPVPSLRMRLYRIGGTRIGVDAYVNMMVRMIIEPENGVTVILGDRVAVAPGVVFAAGSGPNESRLKEIFPHDARSITVENDAWIGANAVILPGIRIGQMAVVAAGAVVTRDVPANTVVAGIPARRVRRLFEHTP